MSAIWTTEQILALAPDASSAKNGKALATLRKWVSLGQNQQAVWGECQGSGKTPYQTQIDLTETAFKCSCPSRKFPCKHGLALFLLKSSESTAFTSDTPPDWVTTWLNTRTQKRAKKSEPVTQEVNLATQAKRSQQRYNKVAAGMQDLDLWLRDLVRQGLAAVQGKPYSFWDGVAARMVDAQAPGVARQLREMASIPHSGTGWQEKLLEKLGRLYLLLEGFKNLDTLPPTTQADVRTLIGWTLTQEELLASDADLVRDRWLILGQRVTEEDKLRVQRLWLWGEESNRAALILNFAHPSQPLETSFVPGTIVDAELVFFESAYKLRAILKTRYGNSTLEKMPGYKAIADMIQAYTKALSCNPWLQLFPAPLVAVIPIQHNGNWFVRDAAGYQLPLVRHFKHSWQLMALSGGHPISLFGEWDGDFLLPLSIVSDQFVIL